TCWVSVPVLVWKSVVPLYTALIGWLAAVRAAVLNVAIPVTGLTGTAAARTVAPSVKSTVPAVAGLAPAVTVAVKVTPWPTVDGLALEVNAVTVGAGAKIVRHQPPAIAPESPDASSLTYRLQVPFPLLPLKVDRAVAADWTG